MPRQLWMQTAPNRPSGRGVERVRRDVTSAALSNPMSRRPYAKMTRALLKIAMLMVAARGAVAQAPRAGADFVIHNFHFADGSALPELRIHYIALGVPRKDANGIVRNALIVLHGTTGSGEGFLSRTFAGELFGAGQLLDTAKYYVVLPDGIGHGGSSKPSDGLHVRFPHYNYDDMVEAQHRLLTEGLGVNHLRLVMGTSMGCMHAWVWGERYPDFVDGLVPLACAPTQIAGRNRMMRKMIIDDIMSDPDWKGGDYASPPRGLRAAMGMLFMMTSAPLQQQKTAATRDAADKSIMDYVDRQARSLDANDVIYAFESSRTYDPSKDLEKVTVPVLAI